MFITQELFDIRHELLRQSLVEERIPAEAAARWLAIDAAFASALVKRSPAECTRRYHDEPVVVHAKPPGCPWHR